MKVLLKDIQKEINDQYYQKKIDEAYERGVTDGRMQVLEEEMLRSELITRNELKRIKNNGAKMGSQIGI